MEAAAIAIANRLDDTRAAALAEANARIAELEAALGKLIAWEAPIELAAPELGGALRAFYEARAVLERK